MVDRLGEIGIEIQPEGETDTLLHASQAGNAEITEHMKLYEPVRENLHLIEANVKEIEQLKEKSRSAMEQEYQKTLTEVEGIIAKTTKLGRTVKTQLDTIKASNIEYERNREHSAGKTQMRENMYMMNARRFQTIMQEYNDASDSYKSSVQDRTRRQLRIVDAEITDAEVEKIVASGQAQDVIQRSLVSANLKDTVRDIEARHCEFLKLERQVLEVYELFKDLATLVDMQGEMLESIETRVANAKVHVGKAEKEIIKAGEHQKSARKKICCLIVCAVVILIIMLSSIIGSVFGKK